MFFLNSIVAIDERVNTILFIIRDPAMVKIFFLITMLGEAPVVIIVALLTSLILWLHRKNIHIATLWLTIIGSGSFTYIAKIVFHRLRPGQAVFLENGGSLPSGHATAAVALYGFIAYILLCSVKKSIYHRLILLISIIVILAIGFSRLYLGVHYISDVVSGYVVGALWLIIGIGITEWKISNAKFK